MSLRIFLSYRRSDVPDAVDRVADRLRDRFGANAVFLDVQGIRDGEDWREVLARELEDCAALLVLIGPDWRVPVAEDDPVRMEIGAALTREIPVLPVLVHGAALPTTELPEELAPLARRNAFRISRERFDYEFDALADSLQSRLGLVGSSGNRILAFLLDLALAVAITALLFDSWWALLAVFALYHGLLVGLCGTTLGKWLVGLRIRLPEDRATRWVVAFFRPTTGYAMSIFSGIGLIQFLLHREHSTLHDRIYNTAVVRARPFAWKLPRAVYEFSQSVDLRLWLALGRLGPVGRAITIVVAAHFGVDLVLKAIAGLFALARGSGTGSAGGTAAAGTGTASPGIAAGLLKGAATIIAHTGPQVVTGLSLSIASIAVYEAVAPPALSLFPRTAEVGDGVVRGRYVLVMSDTSGSMAASADKREAMIAALKKSGMKVVVAPSDRLVNARTAIDVIEKKWARGMDTFFWFSDFRDSSQPDDIEKLREELEKRDLCLYLGTVDQHPGPLVPLAEKTGGGVLDQTAPLGAGK